MKRVFVFFGVIVLGICLMACNQNQLSTGAPTESPTKSKVYTGTWDGSYFELTIEDDFASMVLPHKNEESEASLAEKGISGTVTIETKKVDEGHVVWEADGTITIQATGHWEIQTISGTGAEAYKTYYKNYYGELYDAGTISDEALQKYLKELNGERFDVLILPTEEIGAAEVNLSLNEETNTFEILAQRRYDLEGKLKEEFIYAGERGAIKWTTIDENGTKTVHEHTAEGGGLSIKTYDSAGNLKHEKQFYSTGDVRSDLSYNSDGTIAHGKVYSESGNVIKEYFSDGRVEEYEG